MSHLVSTAVAIAAAGLVMTQCRKPWGWIGRAVAWSMNYSHARLTAWGLGHVTIGADDTLLDVGCGGGATVQKLAALAPGGIVHGIDYSSDSVAASRRRNARAIEAGQVKIHRGSVSKLPFPDRTFDLVTAVETHYYWPDLGADVREVLRVLKPDGRFLVLAEMYRRPGFNWPQRLIMKLIRAKYLTAGEHRELLAAAGFSEIQLDTESRRGWLCGVAKRPASG